MAERLGREFFRRDVLEVAPDLLGKFLVISEPGGLSKSFVVSETEAYRGGDDRACHASKGMTQRTRVMFDDGGLVYMYLIYGMYWMLNVVCSGPGNPQAVLIRGVKGADGQDSLTNGPGKLTRHLGLTGDFYGEDLVSSQRIFLEDRGGKVSYDTTARIGIDYAGDPWKDKPWRYILKL